MSRQPTRRRWVRAVAWPLSFVLLIALYLGNLGLLGRLWVRGHLSDEGYELACHTIYWPIFWIDENTRFFDHTVGRAYDDWLESVAAQPSGE